MTLLEIAKKRNASSIFLVPCLRIRVQDLMNCNFQNSYLEWKSKYKNCIYLLFEPYNLDVFNTFTEKEKLRTNLLQEVINIEGKYIMIYKLPEEFRNDYPLFFEGRYSEFSKLYFSIIPKTIEREINRVKKTDINLVYLIITKDERVKRYWEEEINEEIKGEVWSKPNRKKEILNLKYE